MWTKEEDEKLKGLVKKYEIKNIPFRVAQWKKIAEYMTGRSPKACAARYAKFETLNDIKKGSWTPAEDKQLVNLVKKHGMDNLCKVYM